MEFVMDNMVIIAIAAVFFSLMAMAITYARNYHKVAPNQVAVISGKKSGDKGYRVVTGGGFFLWPVLERIDYLFLNVMSFNVQVQDVPDAKGVLVDVTGVANVKIMSDSDNLPLAVERFLGKTPPEIQVVAKENLESNLRAIVGTMTVEQLNNDRNTLQQRVMAEAVSDLNKLGLGVDVLNIQQVTDKKGYIHALGKARTAQVVRDAAVGEANAQSEAAIAQANATNTAEIARAAATKATSEAQKVTGITVAANDAEVQAARARVSIVAQTAAAEEAKKLNVAEVTAQEARVDAETKLQAAIGARNKAEQEATTLVTARAVADASVIKAQGLQDAAIREGEANRIRDEKTAKGKIALAEATEVEGKALAVAQKAKLLALADGTRAQLEAEAAGTRAKLLAEAEGALKKAEAFKALDEGGRFLMILEASPKAIESLGHALGNALKPAADAIGMGLGNVEEIRIVDMAGNRDGKSVLNQFSDLPIETISNIVAKMQAAGLGSVVDILAKKAGFSLPAAVVNVETKK